MQIMTMLLCLCFHRLMLTTFKIFRKKLGQKTKVQIVFLIFSLKKERLMRSSVQDLELDLKLESTSFGSITQYNGEIQEGHKAGKTK